MIELFLKNLWLWKCGFPEMQQEKLPSLDNLKQSEWDNQFEKLMRNRLVMGAFRYGTIKSKDKPDYDIINSISKRINLYKSTANKEHLVDIANLCMIEFVKSQNPFIPIDDGEHTKIKPQ